MKTILSILLFQLIVLSSMSQAVKRTAKRAGRTVENKIGQKIDQAINNTIDGATKPAAKKTSTKKDTTKDGISEESGNSGTPPIEDKGGNGEQPNSLEAYSKFDFIPGEKILAREEFDADAIGDFPSGWNTNASGEIVSLNSKDGKWLKINKSGMYHPEMLKSLPENFTLEFDLGINNNYDYYSSDITLVLTKMGDPKAMEWRKSHAVEMSLHPIDAGMKNGRSKIITVQNGKQFLNNNVKVESWNNNSKTFVHVSVWRQKQRLRVYINEEKIWDLPRAFDSEQQYDAVVFRTKNFHKPVDYYVLNNIVLAVGAPDTRNKLLKEGKYVTRGILFDVNSDKIKPRSYGVLKDIATVLTENETIKVKIVGHTDSDGDDETNMELSKRRALAVKKALSSSFGISDTRMETDGKGEAQPVSKNTSAEAKADNRRVEFVKL